MQRFGRDQGVDESIPKIPYFVLFGQDRQILQASKFTVSFTVVRRMLCTLFSLTLVAKFWQGKTTGCMRKNGGKHTCSQNKATHTNLQNEMQIKLVVCFVVGFTR